MTTPTAFCSTCGNRQVFDLRCERCNSTLLIRNDMSRKAAVKVAAA